MPGVAIFGITGRMGQSLLQALREAAGDESKPVLRLTGAVASAHSSRLGRDAAAAGDPAGVTITADADLALQNAMVAIDFSLPQCVAANAQACLRSRVPLLVGATGFDSVARASLEDAAATIPLLIAPNTSLGMNVVGELIKLAARALPEADVGIFDLHHRSKRDAPSGSALALGALVAHARGVRLEDAAAPEHGARATPRRAGAIQFAALRAADVVGEHTVTFALAGERVEITHRATDRMIFARGALRAAEWLAGRPPGLYTMQDALL